MKKKSFFGELKKVSTKPHFESYTWGRHVSLLSGLIYHSIFLLRYFSFLQIIKLIFRFFEKKRLQGKSSERLDEKSRLDFHARYTEAYLVFVMIFSITLYYCNRDYNFHLNENKLIFFMVMLLLLESIVWMLYYTMFRVLIERVFTVYNEAEYLVCLPVAIATQVFLVAFLSQSLSPVEVLSLLFNISIDSKEPVSQCLRTALGVNGIIYIAAIIATLINNIPPIPVWKRPNITIIGGGDVVLHRILPAALRIYGKNQLAIASDYVSDELRAYLDAEKIHYYSARSIPPASFYNHEEREKIKKNIIDFISSRSSYAIVATPSDEHFPYILELANRGIKFAVEKPICTAMPHLSLLEDKNCLLMERGFLFSYYWLEKALPLNYFLTLNPTYRDLLKIHTENSTQDTPSALSFEKQKLGKPKLFVLEFLEGDESEHRYWTELQETGGMAAETLVHAMTLAKHVLGSIERINVNDIRWVVNEERQNHIEEAFGKRIGPTYVDMIGKYEACDVRIRVGKYTNYKKRFLHIIYENGKVICDFDSKICTVHKAGGVDCIKIQVKHDGNYETQLLLFDEFMRKGWSGIRFDDYPDQINIIKKCLSLNAVGNSAKTLDRNTLNKWLRDNLLFDSGSLTLLPGNPQDRFGP